MSHQPEKGETFTKLKKVIETLATRTRRLRGDQIEVFKILNGYENIDSNIFFKIKQSKITRGHNFTLVINKVDWMLESFHFPRGPSMYRINYQQSVYMLLVLMCSRIK